jgi:glyoxylase-like metal-dependent hydrolase (beta-lactamase superfamily II)
MKFGNLTLRPVSDGTYWTDGGGFFGLVPRVMWEAVVQPDALNRIELDLRCLLIDDGQQRILVDTGYGDKLSQREREQIHLVGERRLLQSLESIGVGPSEVDVVINTHLHADHCGGNTRYDVTEELVPTFPKATYCIQRMELADALFPNERTAATYRQENVLPLLENGSVRILSGDARLSDQVRVIIARGHTRAHQCVVLESEGQKALVLGDVASWPIHIERLAWIPAYDVEPLETLETRRRLAEWAVEEEVLLIFEHHPQIQAGYLHRADRPGRYHLQPVDLR